MKTSLYVHLPFCARKCAYCDFESYAGKLSERDAYITRLLREAEDAKKEYGTTGVPTVYFGGGTPSLLEPEQIKRLTDGLFSLFPPDVSAEITMEANPGTVTAEKLKTMRQCGINRLSMGVQSSDDRMLERIGRIHTFAQARDAVKMARDAGFENISCDLMYGLPGQTLDGVLRSAEDMLTLEPKHISCYSLIAEENTPLGDAVLSGRTAVPDEDEVCTQQNAVIELLAKRGFDRYEISTYALPGFESRHNTVYWTGGSYLGLGCSAHSYMLGERFSNPRYTDYMRGIRHTDGERVDKAGRLEEKLLLETRLTRGLDLEEIRREYGAETEEKLVKACDELKGFAEIKGSRLLITTRGYEVHNEVAYRLIEAVETAD